MAATHADLSVIDATLWAEGLSTLMVAAALVRSARGRLDRLAALAVDAVLITAGGRAVPSTGPLRGFP